MRKLFLFPGAYCLIRKKHRLKYINLPEVRELVLKAQEIYKTHLHKNVDFISLLNLSDDAFNTEDHIVEASVLSLVIPLGIANHLQNNGNNIDLVMGFSAGNMPAAVIAKGYSFERMVIHTHDCIGALKNMEYNKKGSVYTCFKIIPFTKKTCDWIRSFDLGVSLLNPFVVFVSGSHENLEKFKNHPKTKYWEKKWILNTIMHSPLAKPLIEKAILESNFTPNEQDLPLQGSLYSVLHKKEISSPQDYFDLIAKGLYEEIPWHETIKDIKKKYDISEIITLAPDLSLMKMMKVNPLLWRIKVKSSEELINPELIGPKP